MALRESGVLSKDELARLPGMPSKDRLRRGPVAVIECAQEIPCNPCETACKQGAIRVGDPITSLPVLDERRCTGCGLCIAKCPGQAIFVVNLTYSQDSASVMLPYEFLPLPAKGDEVEALDREGSRVCTARVLKVLQSKASDRTPVVTVAIPRDCAMNVRNIRLRR